MNQLWGGRKSGKLMKMILLVLKIITFTLIIVLLIAEIMKIVRQRSWRCQDRIPGNRSESHSESHSENHSESHSDIHTNTD